METNDVQAILAETSGFDVRFEGLLRRALERIPLRREDLAPLRIFLMGYRNAVATSLACGEAGWHHLIILDRHPLYGRGDEYILEIMAHEIAHVYLGHGKEREAAGPKLCDEARSLVADWGFPGGGGGDVGEMRP
ncbi:MAG: hypothetical protein ACE5KQ_02875 [Thermoplasmata archaeon]